MIQSQKALFHIYFLRLWISSGNLNVGNNRPVAYGNKTFGATHLGNSTISLVTSVFNILNLEFIEFKPKDITAQNRKKRPKILLSNFLGHNFHGAENRRYSHGDLNTEKLLAQFSYEKDSEMIFLFCFSFFSQYRIWK